MLVGDRRMERLVGDRRREVSRRQQKGEVSRGQEEKRNKHIVSCPMTGRSVAH